jgi:hypothetical protein
METVSRDEIKEELYQEVLKTEAHHDHEIIRDDAGVLRWKKNPAVDFLVTHGDLNEIVRKLYAEGHDRNSELHRKLYRDMGYSLHGYWEIFYWEWNNEDAADYIPPKNGHYFGKDNRLTNYGDNFAFGKDNTSSGTITIEFNLALVI